MIQPQTTPNVHIIALITTIPRLKDFLDRLSATNLTTDPPILYITPYFTSLGPIRALAIYISSHRTSFLVSISTLDSAAFTTIAARPQPSGLYLSLKQILESPSIPKVLFNCFETVKAFARYHEVYIDGIADLRIMEMESQDPAYSDVRNNDLPTCIGLYMRLPEGHKQIWRQYQNENHLVEQGGGEGPSGMAWTSKHDTANVGLMSRLWDIYAEKLDRKGPGSWQNVWNVTESHVKTGKDCEMVMRVQTKVEIKKFRESLDRQMAAIESYFAKVVVAKSMGERNS